MNTAQPIRNTEDLERFKNYYLCEEKHPRNQFLIVLGLNTALRITDILSLRWADVYDFKKDCCLSHIMTTERKTKKQTMVYMNQSITSYLVVYREIHKEAAPESFLFEGNDEGHLSRSQAWRIVRHAAQSCGIQGVISPHSLRKTFGYFAWKNGAEPAILMNIYNHSSFNITKRYLGIQQEDRDEIFRRVCI